jgi:hypothetical protein
MDANIIAKSISNVFGEDVTAFELALNRLKLQADLVQINSKIAVLKAQAYQQASEIDQQIQALTQDTLAKQSEIDALEASKVEIIGGGLKVG